MACNCATGNGLNIFCRQRPELLALSLPNLLTCPFVVQIGNLQEAAALGWQPYPFGITRKQADLHAITIQRYARGYLARLQWQEEARLQWIEHFLETNQLAEARALGWQLTPPTKDSDVEGDAATRIQAVQRGRMGRRICEFINLELARLQWVEYYLQKGMVEKAKELGWDPNVSGVSEGSPGAAQSRARKEGLSSDQHSAQTQGEAHDLEKQVSCSSEN